MNKAGGPARRATAEHDASPAAGHDASRAAGHDGSGRVCVWCCGPIPARARRDAVCCSVRCRQARHRFLRTIGRAEASRGVPAAPAGLRRPALPRPGQPVPGPPRLRRRSRPRRPHRAAGRLRRVGAVHLRRSAARRAGPVPTRGSGRRLAPRRPARPGPLAAARLGTRPVLRWPPADPPPGQARRVDSIVCGVTPLTTQPGRVIGAKPAAVCRWIFGLLGAAPGDTLDDLFPGSGAVTRAWAAYTTRTGPSPPARA